MKSEYVANPSIIMAGFGRFDERFDKFKEDANKKGVVIRELKIFDVQIPIDERYNDAVNFLKQNINPILKNYLDFNIKIPFIDLDKILENKLKLKRFDYNTFLKETELGNLFKYGYLGLTPLFVDTKYQTEEYFTSDEEKENYKKLFSLSSENYKPLNTPFIKEEDFNKNVDEDLLYEEFKERDL